MLKEGGVSGPLDGTVSSLPLVGAVVRPGAQKAKNAVDSVNAKNLREILGGQFAQLEGQQLLQRGYNPNFDEKVNFELVQDLRKRLEAAAMAKDDINTYLEAGNRTLKNYKMPEAPAIGSSKQDKTIKKKQYSPSRNQTKIIYSDGSEEIVDGQK